MMVESIPSRAMGAPDTEVRSHRRRRSHAPRGIDRDAAHRAALAALVQAEYPAMVAQVALATGDREGAEDAVQEALARLWDRRDRQRLDNPAAWVVVVASNQARSTHRRRGAETRAYERSAATTVSPSDVTDGVGLSDTVVGALSALAPQQRRIAVLHYLRDLSVADIAALLDVHEGTVKTHLARARTALANALNALNALDGDD